MDDEQQLNEMSERLDDSISFLKKWRKKNKIVRYLNGGASLYYFYLSIKYWSLFFNENGKILFPVFCSVAVIYFIYTFFSIKDKIKVYDENIRVGEDAKLSIKSLKDQKLMAVRSEEKMN